jgi:hypothetical protein
LLKDSEIYTAAFSHILNDMFRNVFSHSSLYLRSQNEPVSTVENRPEKMS